MYNIRVAVPCTELTKQVLFKEYQRSLLTKNTLPQEAVGADIISFNKWRKPGTNTHRDQTIFVLLNKVHSERYKAGYTEAALAKALERKAFELLCSRMWGAFLYCQQAMRAVDLVLDDLEVIETRYERQTLRKLFYRYRERRELV